MIFLSCQKLLRHLESGALWPAGVHWPLSGDMSSMTESIHITFYTTNSVDISYNLGLNQVKLWFQILFSISIIKNLGNSIAIYKIPEIRFLEYKIQENSISRIQNPRKFDFYNTKSRKNRFLCPIPENSISRIQKPGKFDFYVQNPGKFDF